MIKNDMRIGQGYDVHRLVENRKLIIGGVEIPHRTGLDGHSDADVLLHAICDALLGAAAMRDLGFHFSDTDESYKNISSIILLKKVNHLLLQNNWQIGNIDATVVAQSPRLSPYIPDMTKKIADTLDLDVGKINIKATTEEKMGFTGNEEGIAAHAVALIYK